MALTDVKAFYGLQGTFQLTSTNVSGIATVGVVNTPVALTNANVGYSLRAILCGSANELDLNLATNDTTGSTAFVAGTAQVETATITASSGATSAGNMVLVLTSAGMTGSPLNVTVALTTAMNTAALVAAAARTALEAVTVVAERFTIGGTSASITLTRKPTSTFTVPGGTLNLYPANDATLNLAIPSGLGVTAAPTSTNTTAGVLTSGTKIYDGDGKDVEGVTIPAMGAINAILMQCHDGAVSYDDGLGETGLMSGGRASSKIGIRLLFNDGSSDSIFSGTSIAFTCETEPADLTLTVVGTV